MQYQADDKFVYIKPMGQEMAKRLGGVYTKHKGVRFPKNLQAMRELGKNVLELRKIPEFMADGKALAAGLEELTYKKETWRTDYDQLREYQNQDVAFLESRGNLHGGALVLNEPRTGKTPTMIKTIEALNVKYTLVIAPASLTYNWKKEIEKWSTDLTPFVYAGTPKVREKEWLKFTECRTNKILIVSKDTLKKVQESDLYVARWDVAVVDEAHYLRNWRSSQSKAVFELKATTKYALTGTPAVKHGSDVYGLLHFVDPKAFPSYWQFAERYWEIDDGYWGKELLGTKKNRELELKELMYSYSTQRKRKDIMQWLPEAQKQTLFVKMDKKQLKLYDQMLDVFVASMDDVEVDTANKLSQLLRLRQLCLDPRLLGFDVVGAKTEALLELAEGTKEPLVIMTSFSSYFKLVKPELEKLGKRVGIIDGSISQKEKSNTAMAFQRGDYDILLCNIIAAGTGLTLDRSDTIIFLDKAFNPADNEQAQDRIVPTSKEKVHPINIISLVCDGTIDQRVNDILDRKEDLTKIINRPKELVN